MEPEVAWPGVPLGPQGSCGEERGKWRRKRKEKKLIKNKILPSPACLLLGACSSCAPVTEGAAMAQLGGRAKSRIWEKTALKHRWMKPLFPFKSNFNALAALEVLVGLAGPEQVWGECPQREPAEPNPWADFCPPSPAFPILLLFPNPSSGSASPPAALGQLHPKFSAEGSQEQLPAFVPCSAPENLLFLLGKH